MNEEKDKKQLLILSVIMMLAIGILAFAILISGCSSRDELPDEIAPPGERPIEFVSGLHGSLYGDTRGSVVTTETMKDATAGGFGVLAYGTQASTWDQVAGTAVPDLMYNQKVSWGSSSTTGWGYTPVQYWQGEDKATFFAYAPYESQPGTGGDKGIKLSAVTATGAPTLEFTVKDSPAEMVDLVVSDIHNDRTGGDGAVDLYLWHVLSRVRFTARLDASYVDSKIKIFVTGLKLLGKDNHASTVLHKKAVFKFAAQPAIPWEYGSGGSGLQMSDYDLSSVLNKTTPGGAYGYTTEAVEVSSSSVASSLFAADDYLFLIPVNNHDGIRQGEEVKMEVTYDIVRENTLHADGHTTTTVKKQLTFPAGGLKLGYSYNYTLLINLETIKLSAEVVPWLTPEENIGLESPALPPRQPEVGDILLSDGTYVSPSSYSSAGPVAPVGVVFHVGLGEGDTNFNYGEGKSVKGYAVALRDDREGLNDFFIWGKDRTLLIGTSTSKTDFQGYTNTQLIEAVSNYSATSYPACWYAVNNNGTAAPTNSSGWFLPSAGQLAQLFRVRNAVYDSFAQIGSTTAKELLRVDYWSSSEHFNSSREVGIRVVNFDRLFFDWNLKDINHNRVRSVLAFY